MQAVLAVYRIIIFIIRIILWVVLLPFIIAILFIRMVINRLKFKNQLIKSGISKKWADRLSRRYSIRVKDISEFIRFSKDKNIQKAN